MTNEELNEKLGTLADDERFTVHGLGGGKAIPYYGWFWRSVDFDQPITFAYANGRGWDTPSWVGFCENNKWGYEMFTATEEQSRGGPASLRRVRRAVVVREGPGRLRLPPVHPTGACPGREAVER